MIISIYQGRQKYGEWQGIHGDGLEVLAFFKKQLKEGKSLHVNTSNGQSITLHESAGPITFRID